MSKSSQPDSEATRLPEDASDDPHTTAKRYKREYPQADADAIEVSLGLLRTQRSMSAAMGRHLYSLGYAGAMTGARYGLMRTLYFARGQRLAQNELGRAMGVSRTNITNLIDGLEKDGLVERTASPLDRRVSFAQLTPAGEDLLKKLMPSMIDFMETACAGLSSQEKTTFAGLLHRFRGGLEASFLADGAADDEREV
jgi:MarR family 2-MHQ and catechol resistance regulon transcriptional repressor